VVDWLRRRGSSQGPAAAPPDEQDAAGLERQSPGLAAFFDQVSADRSHAVLDLGAASSASLRVYSHYARWIRFADLLADPVPASGWPDVLRSLPPHPERPYDLIFAWDVLDHTPPPERPSLIRRLVEISAEDARLFVVVDASGETLTQTHRFSLLGTDRMQFEATGRKRPAWTPLLPAYVERLLEPFQVTRAFTSQVGLREYVAKRDTPRRRGRQPPGG
jgi:hypothetical protein